METKAEKNAPEMVTVEVNGEERQFPKGKNLLKALLDSGTHVPHYCWHPSLSVAGNCRLCMVQIEDQPRPSIACNMTCTDGLKIKTESELVLDARKGMMEFLLQNHPLDCPICDRGGECMLQRYSMQHGTGTARTVDPRRRFEKPQFDPLIDIERNRCIMCTRCVRFTDEEAGEHVLGVFGRGDRNYIGTEGNGPVSNIFSGNIIDICPVGCLTSKPFRFKARPWELQQVNSTCTLCSAGCETTAWIRDGQVLRVTPPVRKYGHQFTIDEDTERFICNEGRFGNMYANNSERLRKAYVRRDGTLKPVTMKEALKPAAEALKAAATAGAEKVAVLTGTRVTNEEFYLLSRLARVALGTHQIDWRTDYLTAEGSAAAAAAMGASNGDLALLKEKTYGATLFVGSDLKETVPVTGLNLRDAARHGHTELYMIGSRLDGWLSPVAKGTASVAPDAVGALVSEIAGHAGGGKKSRKKDVTALADGLKAHETGLIVLSLDEAYGTFAPDRVAGALELLRALGEGWKFVPVFHGRNAKGAFAAGAQGDRLPAGPLGEEAAGHLMSELWGEVKAQGEAGPCAMEILERAAAGKIETLLLHRPDELVHHPRRALIEKALESTPNVIVIDVFPSWISEKASVILPGAFFFEVEGTLLAADGTIHALMQANLPPGEAQEDWRIIDTLCDLLDAPSRYQTASDVFADLARCWNAPARTRLRDFWLEGPGFESPQRPQPALIRTKTRPEFKVHFNGRESVAQAGKAEAGDKDAIHLLFVINAQGDDHLGSRCTEFAELRPDRRIELHSKDIKKLGLEEGGFVRTKPGQFPLRLEANDSIPAGTAYAAANVLGLEWDGGAGLPAITIEAAEGED